MKVKSNADFSWIGKYKQALGWGQSWVGITEKVIDYSKLKQKKVLSILDVGCGRGCQLADLAELGHKVTGIDISPEAIEEAKRIFDEQGLKGYFHIGELINPPIGKYDYIIDRGAISCCGFSYAKEAYKRLAAQTNKGGQMFTSILSKNASEFKAEEVVLDGLMYGTRGVDQLCYYDDEDLKKVIGKEWKRAKKELWPDDEWYGLTLEK